MPIVEIEEQLLADLQQRGVTFKDASAVSKRKDELEKVYRDLGTGDTAAEFRKLLETKYPETKHPAISELEALRGEFNKYREEQAEAEKKKTEEARNKNAQQTVGEGRTWLRQKKQLDDQGVAAIEQLMMDEGIQNYQVAFNHWLAQQPPAATPLPQSYGGPSLDWFREDKDQPDGNLLIKDPIGFRKQEVAKFFAEKQQNRGAA